MTKIKKIFAAIGAGLAAVFEALSLILIFEKKKEKIEDAKEALENTNANQDAAIAANEKYQEEQTKHEEQKNEIIKDFGSSKSVDAAISLMHNNQKRSKDRNSTGD